MPYQWRGSLGRLLASDDEIMIAGDQNRPSLLSVVDLSVKFKVNRRRTLEALSSVSLSIERGEALGLVGESGCGKSTLARTITLLQKPSKGTVLFDGIELTGCDIRKLRGIRPDLQMIFQDAVASLNPGRSIGKTIAEPLRVIGGSRRKECQQKACQRMLEVDLDPDLLFDRHPFELSVGQCQRVSIARALMTRPKLLLCDEPVSSLDVSIQAQILNLLRRLKSHYNLTLLFISHDLAVVKNICDRVAVMYLGKLCEIGPSDLLYRQPHHPYTQALLAAIPEPVHDSVSPEINLKRGTDLPSSMDPPSGCRFRTRCPRAEKACISKAPEFTEIYPGRWVACHFPL